MNPIAVQALRSRIWQNGFRPVAVKSDSKVPSGRGWTDRARMNPPDAVGSWPESSALSTGILGDGLLALDIDVDDAPLVSQIVSAAWNYLGSAPSRTRVDSPRCLLLYRAVEGEPSKRSVSGQLGKVEALGKGQQFVAFGTHEQGAAYAWPHGSPESFRRDALTPVSQDALTAFLAAIAPMIGAEAPAQPSPLPVAVQSVPLGTPATDRDREYAAMAYQDEVSRLTVLKTGGGRNAALNRASHSLGTLVGNGSIDASTVGYGLFAASIANGHVGKHGEAQTKATIESGMNAGIVKPRALISAEVPNIDLGPMIANGIAAYKGKQVATQQLTGKRSVTVLQGSDIVERPITWLWEGYLPSGKLTLLAGAGGTGKSTIAFNLAATITNAGIWPDGTRCNGAGNVLIWSSEDDPADTIKPRLMAVGADDRRYGVIAGTVDEDNVPDSFDAARDMDGLREAVSRIGGISLLIIDPIVTAVTGDMHKANDVRRSLQAIVDFAAEMNCAVLGITHFAKGTAGRNSAERVIGSQAFAALARMVLVAAKEEESDRRVFTRAKSNNSVDTGGYSYTIEALTLNQGIVATRVVWGEALEGSSRSILAEVEGEISDETSQLGIAKQFLTRQLANGPAPSKELMEHAREGHGVSVNTLRRAQKDLGIMATKVAFSGGWMWSLPFAGKPA